MLFLHKKSKTTVFSMEFGSYTGMGQFIVSGVLTVNQSL